MTISVVIPVYNEEKRILDTLKAIYDGSEMPREVIVVDGCSTDRTVNIIMTCWTKCCNWLKKQLMKLE